MVGCVAFGCTNRSGLKRGPKKPGITFHKFPKESTMRSKWVSATRRKDWSPTKYSCLCSEHFRPEDIDRTSMSSVRIREGAIPSVFPAVLAYLEDNLDNHFDENQWEMGRADGKKKLKTNAVPTIFCAPEEGKRTKVRVRKDLRVDDEAVIEYIEKMEAIEKRAECVVCCRPLLDDKKECLSTLTATTGISLHQCLVAITCDNSSKIQECSDSDSVCYCCAQLINYADKMEAELAKLKIALNGCLEIKSMSEDEQVMMKPEFDSHVAILDEFSERVVGSADEACDMTNEVSDNDNVATVTIKEEVIAALGTRDSINIETQGMESEWGNRTKTKVNGDKVRKPQASEPLEIDHPVLTCQLCQLRTTSRSVLLFHLRRHMANRQWCDFCDTPIHDDDEDEIWDFKKPNDVT